jgi:hypothetical protein
MTDEVRGDPIEVSAATGDGGSGTAPSRRQAPPVLMEGERIEPRALALAALAGSGVLALIALAIVILVKYGLVVFLAAQVLSAVVLAIVTTIVLPWHRERRRGAAA